MKKSKEEYVELNTYVAVEDSKVPEPEEEIVEPLEEDPEEVPEESVIDVDFDMDYESLKEINKDFVGWIYYEPLEISYPVVIDKGNDYYEKHSFNNESNVAGAIFMDYLCRSDFNSFNTIVYGHNMRNGTMFGKLNKLIDEPDITKENPYFYIFTENEARKYRIVSAYYTGKGTKSFEVSLNDDIDTIQEYIDYFDGVSVYRDEDFFAQDYDENLKICTLATCHGLHSNTRTIVHGVLEAVEKRK